MISALHAQHRDRNTKGSVNVIKNLKSLWYVISSSCTTLRSFRMSHHPSFTRTTLSTPVWSEIKSFITRSIKRTINHRRSEHRRPRIQALSTIFMTTQRATKSSVAPELSRIFADENSGSFYDRLRSRGGVHPPIKFEAAVQRAASGKEDNAACSLCDAPRRCNASRDKRERALGRGCNLPARDRFERFERADEARMRVLIRLQLFPRTLLVVQLFGLQPRKLSPDGIN